MANQKIFTFRIDGITETSANLVTLGENLKMADKLMREFTDTARAYAEIQNRRTEANQKLIEADQKRIEAEQRRIEADLELTEATQRLLEADRIRLASAERLIEADQRRIEATQRLAGADLELINAITRLIEARNEWYQIQERSNVMNRQLEEQLRLLTISYGRLHEEERATAAGRELLDHIQETTEVLDDFNKMVKLPISTMGDFGETLGRLSVSFEHVNAYAKNFNKLFQDTNDVLVTCGIENQQLTDIVKNLGDATKVASDLQSIYSGLVAKDSIIMQAATIVRRLYNASVEGGSRAMGVFRGIMASMGFGLILIAVGALVANFDKLKKIVADSVGGMGALNNIIETSKQVLTGLGNVILQVVITPYKALYEAITSVIDAFSILSNGGGWSNSFQRLKDGASDTFDVMKDGYNVVKNYEDGVKFAAEGTDRLTEAMDEARNKAAESIAPFKSLQAQWNNLADDMAAKKKFIEENGEAFKKLGVEINSVEDAENLLKTNAPAFIKITELKAKATAAQQLATALYVEALKKELAEEKEAADQLNQQADDAIKKMQELQSQAGELTQNSGFKVPSTKPKGSSTKPKKEKEEDKQEKVSKEDLLRKEEELKREKLRIEESTLEAELKIAETKLKSEADTADKVRELQIQLRAKKKEISEAELEAEKEKFDKMMELARKQNEDTSALQKLWEDVNKEHINISNNELLKIQKEHEAKIIEIIEQSEKDKTTIRKKYLDDMLKEITEAQKNATEKDDHGLIDTKKTKKNLSELAEQTKTYLAELAKDYTEKSKIIDDQLKNEEVGSDKYKALMAEKAALDKQYTKDLKTGKEKEKEVIKAQETVFSDSMKTLKEKMEDVWKKIGDGLKSATGIVTEIFDEQIRDIKERLTETTKELEGVVQKRKDTQSTLNSLEEQAKNASGGRAAVLQAQIATQMQANEDLARQEQELAKKKEKLEKDAAKKEKAKQKIDLGNKLIASVANTAIAVVQALTVNPFPVGVVMASLAGAMGAVQTGIIARQISKLEDGGLLRGKRHAQGGMRIEGTNIEVEGDEYVVNRASTNKNLGLLEYINRERRQLSAADVNTYFSRSGETGRSATLSRMYEDGGKLTNLETIGSVTAAADSKVIEAISQINFRPVVSVVDISNAQNKLTEIREIAGA